MSYTSRLADNDVDEVRMRLRRNLIAHKDFDVSLRKKDTERYFKGIYQRNNLEHVREHPKGAEQPRNLYVLLD